MNDLIQSSFDYAALPVESIDRLKTWKTEIAAFTDTVESSLVQIGLRFQKAQDELNRQGIKGDGFVAWIESETKYSCSSAYNLIGVATRFKDKPFPNFGKSVLYALSAPSTPDSVVQQAIEKAESGEKVTVADVKDWKAELEVEKQRTEEFRQESNERRKKVRELEEQVDLLTIRDRMMQDRLEQATQEINYLASVVPEPEKVVVPPDDYETTKAKAAQLESELEALKKAQARLVNNQVKAKLHERQAELDKLEQDKQLLDEVVARKKVYLASLDSDLKRIETHQKVIEENRLHLISLAAFLSDEDPVQDADTLKRWRALADMLAEAMTAVRQYAGDSKPALSVIRGDAA